MSSISNNNVTPLSALKENPLAAFDKHFNAITVFLCQWSKDDDRIKWSIDRIKEVVEYNVPHGKKTRGRTVIHSFMEINGIENILEEELNIAMSLGWAVEIMQAAFLVADDIMDQSETRRGKLCWYKNKDVGLQAVNDSLVLESCIFRLAKACCSHKQYYINIVELFHEILFNTEMGQSLDMATSEQPAVDFTNFTYERYLSIVKYKTVYYSFYLPVAIAMYMSCIDDESVHEEALGILEMIGTLFQIQDDYLDVYGDPEVTGKVGTDIEDNKCSWIIIKALEICTKEQRLSLEENYASRDPQKVAIVKKIYEELKLKNVFLEYEKESYNAIKDKLSTFNHEKIPHAIFLKLLETIYQRKK